MLVDALQHQFESLAVHAQLAVDLLQCVFARGVGESTDVVSKEMWTFADRNGESFTLRRARLAEDTFYFDGEREGKSAFEAQLIFKHL